MVTARDLDPGNQHQRWPVQPDEITPPMLTPARAAAETSGLPQTVWATRYVGRDYVGTDCLLGYSALGTITPPGATGDPLLTVLSSEYLARHSRRKGAT